MHTAVQFTLPWLTHNITPAIACLVLFSVALRVFYYIVLSPLSAIPGPWYAAVSDLWLTSHVLRLQQCKTVEKLFQRYGPVVRVGPNKVVFRDVSSMRSVYSVQKFDKSTYYKSLLTNEHDHAMTTLDHASHVSRRKGYAPHYTSANLALFQPEIHDIAVGLIKSLEQIAGRMPLDCLTLFRHFMMDILVYTSFGHRLGAFDRMNPACPLSDPHGLCTAVALFPIRGVLRSAVPTWAWNLLCRIPHKRWRQICDSDKVMAEFVSARVQEVRAQTKNDKIVECEKIPMLHRLLRYRYPMTNTMMPDLDIISESMGHMIAGTDTSSTSLSYFFWELSQRSDIMQKLQHELDEVMHDSHTIPDIAILQRLPYLNAFVKEGLRLYGAAPSLLERVVPSPASKGTASTESFDLMGFELPPHTVVATQAWSMHRDASIFPSPDTFIPDRWLEAPENSSQLLRMAQHLMPFGTGSRICGGQNLAQLMLKISVAAIVRNFDIVAPPETNERTMEMRDSFVIFPASMRCNLIFKPRQHQ